MAETTTDHKTIRSWAEERDGAPATVDSTADKNEPAGVLRIDFSHDDDDSLTQISWEEFFDKFDSEKLAFLYEDKTDEGDISRFCKFISRD